MPDSKQLSKKRYANAADHYVTSETHARGSDLDRLLAIAQPQASWHILDIATGGGHTALTFAPHVASVIASDLTPQMLAKAQAHHASLGITNIRYQEADAENLPFAEGTFDLVTCRIAPHHFPDTARFVRESARVLKVGGFFLLQDIVLPEDAATATIVDGFEKLRDPSHNRAFSHQEWLAMITEAGLQITHSEEYIKRHNFVDWTARQTNTEAIIQQLIKIVETGSSSVVAWMQPQAWNTPDATFVNHHLIVAAHKA